MSRNVQIHYKKNKHQATFHADIETFLLNLSSGYGGGKSYAAVMKVIQLSALNKDLPGGIVVPSISDYKKDFLPLMEEILDENRVKYDYHKTDKVWRFPWSKGKCYVATAERKIKGPNWAYAVINEVGLIAWERYQDVMGRVRIKTAPNRQIASSGTPEGEDYWTYEKFVEEPMPNSRIIYGDTRDNQQNLADGYVEQLEGTYDQFALESYVKGLFTNTGTNKFYYSYQASINDDESIRRKDNLTVHVSMDFNVDPMCATLWHIVPAFDHRGIQIKDIWGNPMSYCFAFDQIEIPGREDGAKTENMCNRLKEKGCDGENTIIYPDPAGKARKTDGRSDIVVLEEAGFKDIRYRSAAPRFRRRQLGHNNLLDKGFIKLNPKTCKGLKKDYQKVKQNTVDFSKIKDNPKLTHHSDGADYMLDWLFPLQGKKPESKNVRIR